MRIGALDGVMVDLDGTLVDTAGDFATAVNLMLEDLALRPVEPALVRRLIGRGANALVREVLAAAAGTLPEPKLLEHAGARYRAHYVANNGRNASVYPGVVEGLERLAARGLPLACVTNKLALFALPLLRHMIAAAPRSSRHPSIEYPAS